MVVGRILMALTKKVFEKRGEFHLAVILCARLCIAKQNLSIGVNVVCKESPSQLRSVRRISLGITIRPKSSTLRTIPVAFIYLSPFPVGNDLCVVPFRFAMWNGTQAVPYNNFTNYDAIICKRGNFILRHLLFVLRANYN